VATMSPNSRNSRREINNTYFVHDSLSIFNSILVIEQMEPKTFLLVSAPSNPLQCWGSENSRGFENYREV